MNKILVENKEVLAAIRAAFKVLKVDGVALDVYLVSEKVITGLNKKFRRFDKATNVLSFENGNFPHPETKLRYLGEIYLCPAYILKELRVPGVLRGVKPEMRLMELAVHGALHLLGYNHEKKSDRIEMEKIEDKIFKENVFYGSGYRFVTDKGFGRRLRQK
ncbi:MAG: rRNA maturation RNase YbeY [Candidatus Wolfebacteria bacterium]|nr:rRNA maturation RNase YbeY [Candidatus Wolfebacteria bacterium]